MCATTAHADGRGSVPLRCLGSESAHPHDVSCPLLQLLVGVLYPPPPLKYPPPPVFPICHTHVLALLSHYFKSVTGVYSVKFSLQRRCAGCPFCGVTQVDHESAELSRIEAVVDASPKSPESPGITPIVSQSQTPAQPASLLFCLLASVERTAGCLGIPLQSPPPPQGGDCHLATVPPPPPRGGRRSRATGGGDFRGGGGG